MKTPRQQMLLEIINQECVNTQKDLVMKLRAAGYKATQTTVSRDITQLRLVKGVDSQGRYRYIQPHAPESIGLSTNALAALVLSANVGGNTLVIRTQPAAAGTIAVTVDKMELAGALGSIAGDDTIFVVFNTAANANIAQGIIRNFFMD